MMIGKRETSISVADLQDFHSVSDSIKRLAISIDGHPSKSHSGEEFVGIDDTRVNPTTAKTQTSVSNAAELMVQDAVTNNFAAAPSRTQPIGNPIKSILSHARSDFTDKYELLSEIGRGGFSTVYQCKDRENGVVYAVKVVDLRPLRLRERFNPSRLRREVDIMRRLKHPNIIQFVEVFETADQLMMIMEYCPGDELFDVILARKFFSEDDAKPIFAQICRALFYLHSLNIIHRDIKPENVLIMRTADPVTGHVTAKLLDFGLSKNAGAGSSAKTFVGTPCYLAPEVEYTSKGLGGTYGLPADCWSLGAVLYVMLVARFPEFEQDASGSVVLRLPPFLWDDVSSDAKNLIRFLMNTNPAARLTVGQALQHPWFGSYRVAPTELSSIADSCYDFSRGLQDEEEELSAMDKDMMVEEDEITAGGNAVHRQAMVLRQNDRYTHTGRGANAGSAGQADDGDQLALRPLLHLQRSIAACFKDAHESYADIPEVATQIRKGAALCRQQLMESTKMLRKVEQTACAVLDMFPDLELAVEEGEPQLATAFFNMVRGWVVELRTLVHTTQEVNKASMNQIQMIVEQSTLGLQHRARSNSVVEQLSVKLINMVNVKLNSSLAGSGRKEMDIASDENLTSEQVLELFLTLFGHQTLPLAIRNNGQSGNVTGHNNSDNSNGNSHVNINNSNDENESNSNSRGSNNGRDANDHEAHKRSTVNLVTHHHEVVPNISSPTPSDSAGNTKSAKVNTTRDSLMEEMMFNPTIGTGTVGGSEGSAFNSPRSVKMDVTPTQPSSGSAQRHSHSTPSQTWTTADSTPTSTPTTDAHGSQGLGVESHVRPPRHTNTPTPAHAHTPSSQHTHPQGSNHLPSPTQGSNQQPSDVVECSTLARSTLGGSQSSTSASFKLQEALSKLRQVDVILEQLSVFWANTEVVLDVLTKKGQHIEQFIGFSHKPRLIARFRDRMEEYKRFWEGINIMCNNYVLGVNQHSEGSENNNNQAHTQMHATSNETNNNSNKSSNQNREHRGVMYDFLDRDDRSNSGGSDTGSVESKGPTSHSFKSSSGVMPNQNSSNSTINSNTNTNSNTNSNSYSLNGICGDTSCYSSTINIGSTTACSSNSKSPVNVFSDWTKKDENLRTRSPQMQEPCNSYNPSNPNNNHNMNNYSGNQQYNNQPNYSNGGNSAGYNNYTNGNISNNNNVNNNNNNNNFNAYTGNENCGSYFIGGENLSPNQNGNYMGNNNNNSNSNNNGHSNNYNSNYNNHTNTNSGNQFNPNNVSTSNNGNSHVANMNPGSNVNNANYSFNAINPNNNSNSNANSANNNNNYIPSSSTYNNNYSNNNNNYNNNSNNSNSNGSYHCQNDTGSPLRNILPNTSPHAASYPINNNDFNHGIVNSASSMSLNTANTNSNITLNPNVIGYLNGNTNGYSNMSVRTNSSVIPNPNIHTDSNTNPAMNPNFTSAMNISFNATMNNTNNGSGQNDFSHNRIDSRRCSSDSLHFDSLRGHPSP